MTFTAITLADPATGRMSVIMPRDGVTVLSLEVAPSPRVVSDQVPGADGEADTTEFADAAAVTLGLRLWTAPALTPEAFLDELGPLLALSCRPQLIVSNDGWSSPRMLTVRYDSRSGPWSQPGTVDVALSWKAPLGLWQDTAALTYSVTSSANPGGGVAVHATTGVALTAAAGISLSAGSVGSDAVVTVPGSARPPWTAQLYGPCTGPKLANDTTGEDLIFTDALVLTAGQYVAIDSASRTALLMSDPAQSVLSMLDFADTTWWRLQAGDNLLRYHPTSGAGQALITFTPARTP